MRCHTGHTFSLSRQLSTLRGAAARSHELQSLLDRVQAQLRDARAELDDTRAESELTRTELAAAIRDRDAYRARAATAEAAGAATAAAAGGVVGGRVGATTEYVFDWRMCVS